MKAILVIMLSLSLIACSKPRQHFGGSGTVTGIDYAMCACCGGYILKMDGNDSVYRFFYFPAGSIPDTTHFPLRIWFDYDRIGDCYGTYHYLKMKTVSISD